MEIAERISILLKSKGFNAVKFAEALEIPSITAYRWLNGESKPQFDHLQKICQVFNVNPDWLILGNSGMYRTDTATEFPTRFIPLIDDMRVLDNPDNLNEKHSIPILEDGKTANVFAAYEYERKLLSPVIKPGDIILLQHPIDIPKVGDIVVIKINGDYLLRVLTSTKPLIGSVNYPVQKSLIIKSPKSILARIYEIRHCPSAK